MNFLAHFHLAWPDEGLIGGGLEGDYYKGPLRGDLPPPLARGIRLHRAIDAYTDSHPSTAALRRELPRDLRRFAGILIDLSFYHFLSVHWEHFSRLPLGDFTASVYAKLEAQETALSSGARSMLQRMLRFDLLGRYGDWRTVGAAAGRIGERFGHRNPLENVEANLEPLRGRMEAAFLDFYPDLQAFSAQRIRELHGG